MHIQVMQCRINVKQGMDMTIKIGKFTLSLLEFEGLPTEIWIQTDSGEAGAFKLSQFEKVVADFYEENF